jgi:hypothetical protein
MSGNKLFVFRVSLQLLLLEDALDLLVGFPHKLRKLILTEHHFNVFAVGSLGLPEVE